MPPITTTTQPPLPLNTMAQLILAYHALPWQRADEMLSDPEGAALLTLLCNASAKGEPVFYLFKNRLLRWAIDHASDWWATPHAYGDAYEADTVIYIQTEKARLSYHVQRSDEHLAGILADPPRSDRGWNGVALQPIAKQLVREWLDEHRECLPFDGTDQQ